MMRQPVRSLTLMFTLAAMLAATPAITAAQDTPLTGAEFEALTTGRTLTFGIGGEPYGIEQYRENRRVVWAFIDGECRTGSWYESGTQICFVYDDEPGERHCWSFFQTAEGLRARLENATNGGGFVEVEHSPTPLYCPGPRVGV